MRTILILLMVAAFAGARDPQWGGLASVAVSPDGKTLVVGGDNRVLYILDAASLEVKNRIWIKSRIGYLIFNKDGSRLVVEDDDEKARFFDTSNWEENQGLKKFGWFSAAPGVDLMAGETGNWSQNVVSIASLTDGEVKSKIDIAAKSPMIALSADGKMLAVLSEQVKNEEKRVGYSDIPKELKGLEKNVFRLKNDGYGSTLTVYDVSSGKKLREHKLFLSPRRESAHMILDGENTHIFGYDNVCCSIDKEGKVTTFEAKNSYNYGRGGIGRTVLTGGLARGTRIDIDGMKMSEFKLDRMPGWPEYFGGFTVGPDGVGYGVTSAYRLVRITKDGKVDKTIPIY